MGAAAGPAGRSILASSPPTLRWKTGAAAAGIGAEAAAAASFHLKRTGDMRVRLARSKSLLFGGLWMVTTPSSLSCESSGPVKQT